MNTTNWLLSLSRSGNSSSDSHANSLSLFLPEFPLQLVNSRCSGLAEEDHFCRDPTADLKDFGNLFPTRRNLHEHSCDKDCCLMEFGAAVYTR